MIVAEKRYFNYTHRLSDYALSASVTTLYDGQWLMLNSSNEFVISDGSLNNKSYITLSSKWGDVSTQFNAPITQGVLGRDTVSPSGKCTVLIGPFRLETDQYVTDTYVEGMPLKIYDGAPDDDKNGKLIPCAFESPADNDTKLATNIDELRKTVAYVCKVPASATDTIGITHE